MSLFGWSLPAGCGTLPGEEDDGPEYSFPRKVVKRTRKVWYCAHCRETHPAGGEKFVYVHRVCNQFVVENYCLSGSV